MGRKWRGDKKALEIARIETVGRGNLGSHCFQLVQLIPVAGFDGRCASFIRENLLSAVLCQTPIKELAFHRNALQLRGDHEDYLALRRMDLVMCEELAGSAAAVLLEFFCKLSRNAKLPIRHHINARGECFC